MKLNRVISLNGHFGEDFHNETITFSSLAGIDREGDRLANRVSCRQSGN
jgi:hypothetical protein